MAGIVDFLSSGLFTKTVDVDENNIRWQNGLVAKLHFVTGTLLSLFTFTVFAKELLGDHIRCIRYSEGSQVSEEAFNSYCYITETFTLPGVRGEVHPGVAPLSKEVEPVYHSYYQWIPYLLFFQATSFYLPYMLNKFAHDNRITRLIQDLQNVIPFNEFRQDKIGDIHLYTQDFYGSHGPWAAKLVLSDFMNFINITLNIFVVNLYLKGSFLTYGPRVLMYQLSEKEEWGVNPFTTLFPKMTKCTLELFGPSGSVVNHDGLCVLPINVLNERIYLLIWFIFFPLFFITLIDQVFWLFIVLNKTYRNKFLLRWVQRDQAHKSHKNARAQLRKTLSKIDFGDWLLLYMIARNIDRTLFTNLASNLYPPGSGYYPDEVDMEQQPLK